MGIRIEKPDIQEILAMGRNEEMRSRYDESKHRLCFLDQDHNEILYLRLPIDTPPLHAPDMPATGIGKYILLLIRSGHAALGLFNNGVILDHKVITAYMVRKKQGKSQVKYLKTKGKSRAGSRVRLAGTEQFFHDIHQRLNRYFDHHTIRRINMSCSTTLVPYFFNRKPPPPFTRKDPRLIQVPVHVHRPGYKELLRIHQILLRPEIIFREPAHAFSLKLIQKFNAASL